MREDTINLDESLDKKYDYTRMPINATPAYVMDEYEFEVASSKHVVRFMKGNVNGKRTSIILFGKRQGKAVLKKYDGISDMRKYLATILAIFREAVGNPNTKMTNRRDGFALIFTYKMFDKVGERFIRMFRMLFNKEYSYSKTTFVSHEENANTFFFWKKGRSFESVFPDALVMDGEEAVAVADEPQYTVAEPAALPSDYNFDLAHGIKPAEITKTTVKTTKKFKDDLQKLHKSISQISADAEPSEIANMISAEIAKFNSKNLSPEKLANAETAKIKKAKVALAPKEVSIISSPVSTLVNENLSMITDSAEVEKIFAELKTKTFPYIPTMTYDEAVETLIYETVTVYMDSFKNTTPEYVEKFNTTMPVFDYESDKQKLKEAKITIYADGLKTGKTEVSTFWAPYNFIDYIQRNFGYIRLSKYDDMMTGVKLVKSISISQIAKRILVTSSMRQNTEFSRAFSLFYGSELQNIENAYDGLKDMDEMIERIKNTKSISLDYTDMFRFFSKVRNSLNPDDFVKLNRLFPDDVRYVGLESTPVAHAKKFVKNWFASGSSYSQAIAHLVADKMGPGTNLDSYWNTINKREGDMDAIKNDRIAYSAYLTRDYNKDVSQRALNDIYEKTQEILTSKYGENGSVELYRGVSLNHDNLGVYTPGVFESWTNSEKSARDFSTNVMTARIPISGIWSTYDILKNMFPMSVSERYAEEKEWIVMGGILAKTEIISHKVGSKVTIKSLGEWVLGEDSSEKKEDDEGILMKIMTPSDPRFKKLLASGKIVLGNPDKGKK